MAQVNAINNRSSELTIDPGASGDSFLQFSINTTGEFRIGVDDDADDTFKISQGSALGTNDTLVMTAAGERTMPLQPAFHAYLGTSDSLVTGDGTAFTLGSGNALTEVFDQGSDFVTTGTFTAPIAGRYLFQISLLTKFTTSGHTTYQPQIVTSNNTFNLSYTDGFADIAASEFLGGQGAVLANMDASDICTFVIIVSGSTKIVRVHGSINFTFVSGELYC